MNITKFFLKPVDSTHRQYEALRMFFVENKTADQVATKFGYTINTIYTLVRDFRAKRKQGITNPFFVKNLVGRKIKSEIKDSIDIIIALRKKYFSVQDIKTILDAQDMIISEKQIHNILKKEGFARLPRRNKIAKQQIMSSIKIEAMRSMLLDNKKDNFCSQEHLGVLCLLPYICSYGIDKVIQQTGFPGTQVIPPLNAILAFVALKASNVRRYTADDIWCMDRSLGLFAGLNVLPKAAWFTSYSHRITRTMNLKLLQGLNKVWKANKLVADTANLDFVTIPYWGTGKHLEYNWSGKRNRALQSIQAAISQDPDSGIITYGNTTIRHNNNATVVLEFLDFYSTAGGNDLKYLVFDSKFTTYQNLSKLDDANIKFITIRRRSQKMVEYINNQAKENWKKIRVPCSNKTRELKVLDEIIKLQHYGKNIRQLSIAGNGRIKPAIIITNDFKLPVENIVHKYARRWLVEKNISEQTYFFHLNNISSSMVIKVDFDLTMTILTYNLYRLFAQDLEGYSSCTPATLHDKFFLNGGTVQINSSEVIVSLKKKRHLPAILTAMELFENCTIPWLDSRKIKFVGATYS